MASGDILPREVIDEAMDLWNSHMTEAEFLGITDVSQGVVATLVERFGLSKEEAIEASDTAFTGLRAAIAKSKTGGEHV